MAKKILQKIIVKGAREHNLNNINIDIPRKENIKIFFQKCLLQVLLGLELTEASWKFQSQ